MFSKILLASDGSENAIRAARITRELAEHFGARVTLLCVVHIPPVYKVDLADQMEEGIVDEWKKILHSTAGVFSGSETSLTRRLLRDVSPVEGILTEFETGDYDLIVMGRTGKGGSPRRNLGSVTMSVMQESNRSILIV